MIRPEMCIEKVHFDFMLMFHVKHSTFCMLHYSYPMGFKYQSGSQTHPEQEVKNKEEVFETHCDPVALLILIHAAHLFCWREERRKEMEHKMSSHEVVDVHFVKRTKRRRWAGA